MFMQALPTGKLPPGFLNNRRAFRPSSDARFYFFMPDFPCIPCHQTPVWPALQAHAAQVRAHFDLRQAFAEDGAARFARFSQAAPHCFIDLSKNLWDAHAHTLLLQLGGPGMRIGMGGGAASSLASGQNDAALDFDSVQRGNPEMQRRAQEVINHCCALGADNPILAIHDVGAGGLSNAFPELVHDAGRGACFDLRAIPLQEQGLSAQEIWCNESQERYVLAIAAERLAQFEAFCQRERCPFAVVGQATQEPHLLLHDSSAAEEEENEEGQEI